MAMFKAGDVVQLKSGGPLMTVLEIDGNKVQCRWFDKTDEKSSSFQSELLQAANPGHKFAYVPGRRRPIL
jgi:uncharacterized protein YodC (DUF2158 family)